MHAVERRDSARGFGIGVGNVLTHREEERREQTSRKDEESPFQKIHL
jgi:hypothetical protein